MIALDVFLWVQSRNETGAESIFIGLVVTNPANTFPRLGPLNAGHLRLLPNQFFRTDLSGGFAMSTRDKSPRVIRGHEATAIFVGAPIERAKLARVPPAVNLQILSIGIADGRLLIPRPVTGLLELVPNQTFRARPLDGVAVIALDVLGRVQSRQVARAVVVLLKTAKPADAAVKVILFNATHGGLAPNSFFRAAVHDGLAVVAGQIFFRVEGGDEAGTILVGVVVKGA